MDRNVNGMALTFTAAPGLLYSVYYKDEVGDSEWIALAGATQQEAVGASITILDPNAPLTSRYYKIIVE